MKRDDVLAVGKLVLAAVALGAVVATAGPAVSRLLLEGVVAWLGR